MTVHSRREASGNPPALSRRAAAAAKRRRILEAAVAVFARDGYPNAKVSAVAKTAGVADGTIYLYFESKEALLLTLFEELCGEFLEEAREAMRGVDDPRKQLATLASIHLQKLAANRDLAIVFQVELRQSMRHLTHITKSRLKVYLRLIKTIIEEAKARGLVRADLDPIVGAHIVFGALDALITSWVLSGQPKNLASLGPGLADTLMAGMAATPAEIARRANPAATRPREEAVR